MWLSAIVLWLCGLPAAAQITSLATDGTGSTVVFSSAASLNGLEHGDDERIWLKPGGEPVLVAELSYRSPERGLMWPAISG